MAVRPALYRSIMYDYLGKTAVTEEIFFYEYSKEDKVNIGKEGLAKLFGNNKSIMGDY